MSGRGAFFVAGDARLYGFLHPAAGDAREAVVLVHPFMEERQDAHPYLRDLATRIAAGGRAALRFDLRGCGDSSGEWEDATIAAWLDDIAHACAHAKASAGVDRVVLAGLRFGATLAAMAAERAGADRVALIQPVTKGEGYFMEVLRAHLAAEMALHGKAGITRDALVERLRGGDRVNIFGYQLTPAQYDEMRRIELAPTLAAYAGDVLLVDVLRTATSRGSSDLAAIATSLGARCTLARTVEPQPLYVEGKLHITRAQEVERAVLAWLDAKPAAG